MGSFDEAIGVVLEHEGGYVNDPADPGGETRYGISKRSYPDVDIASLSLEGAKAIYRRDFWRYDKVEDQLVATKIFDMAVNMGPVPAHRIVQQACGIQTDGAFGPGTTAAVNARGAALLAELRARAAVHYARIIIRTPTSEKYLLGWMRRAVN